MFISDFDARKVLPNLTCYETREEWLEARTGKLTSSTSAKFGVGKMAGYRLNLELRGLLEPKAIDIHPDALEWGQRIEPVVLQKLREDYPSLLISDPGHALCVHPEHPWLADSPDFYCYHPDMPGIGAGEIKSVQRFRRDDWLPNGDHGECVVPDYPLAQLQHHCLCSGAQWGIVAMFTGSGWDARFHSEFVWRDDQWINDKYMPRLSALWESITRGVDWPEVEGYDAKAALYQRFGQHIPGKEVDLADLGGVHERRVELSARVKEAKAIVSELEYELESERNKIREAMQDAEYGQLEGVGTYTWRTGKRGRRLTFRKAKR